MLQQVAPYAEGVKYIATIRDPYKTLISCYEHRKAQGRLSPPGIEPPTLLEFAKSPLWTKALNEGSIDTIYDHFVTFWQCRHSLNFLLIPFEDFTANKGPWLPILSKFMNIPCSPELIQKICEMTSLDSMLQLVNKFDESWVVKQSQQIGRAHPTINQAAAKVTKGHKLKVDDKDLDSIEINEINNKMWYEKVQSKTGLKNYSEMRNQLREMYFYNEYST